MKCVGNTKKRGECTYSVPLTVSCVLEFLKVCYVIVDSTFRPGIRPMNCTGTLLLIKLTLILDRMLGFSINGLIRPYRNIYLLPIITTINT